MTGISFIVPAYNEEKLVRMCIGSIYCEMLCHKDVPYEVIVVDNNSTDNTRWEAQTFADAMSSDRRLADNFRVVLEGQQGVVFSRQAGYKEAKYDILAFIDADNELLPYWVTKLLKYLEDENIVAVSGPIVYMDMSNRMRLLTNCFYSVAKVAHHVIGPMLQGGNFVIRKSILDKIGGFDTEAVEFYGEETHLAKRIAKHGKIVWDSYFNCHSSGRRMENQGVFDTGGKYVLNYLWVTMFNRPYNTKEHRAFRP